MQKTWRSHLMVAYSLAILAFLYLPLLILAMYSFNESRINAVWTGFTFNWYEALFQNRRVLEALTNSLFIAVISTIASTTLGTIAAIALNRYQYKYKPIINGLLYLPILIPEIVMGLSLLVPLSLRTSPSVSPSLSSLSTPDWKACGMNWNRQQWTCTRLRGKPSATSPYRWHCLVSWLAP